MALSDQETKDLNTYIGTLTIQLAALTMAKADLQSELRTNADALSDGSVNSKLAGAKGRINAAATVIKELT